MPGFFKKGTINAKEETKNNPTPRRIDLIRANFSVIFNPLKINIKANTPDIKICSKPRAMPAERSMYVCNIPVLGSKIGEI